MAGTRREARERALEILYEVEMKASNTDDVLRQLPLQPDPLTVELVQGVDRDSAEIDTIIAGLLKEDWSLDRIGTLDRLVLRLGVWELRCGATPRAVVLSEAVELAKRYGGPDSARFVNGLLAAVA